MTRDGSAARPPLVELTDVSVRFTTRGRRAHSVTALDHVSLALERGRTLGVVGESGSGKTTLGTVLVGLRRPDRGSARFDGLPVRGRGAARRLKGRLQVVLQNPDWSLNPSLRVWRSVGEPLVIAGERDAKRRRAAVDEMLARVGLDVALGDRRPHELSGGQRQRVAIARAVLTRPELILFDEAVTALDASVQTQILNLIRDLQAERGFAAVFISHDLAAVRYVSHEIAVFRLGVMVERGPVERFYGDPEHEYSRELLSSLTPSDRSAAAVRPTRPAVAADLEER